MALADRCERPVVEADPSCLRQLFMVLLDNAVKHSQLGGQVRLTCLPATGGVRVSVEDDGDGIPSHDLPHVFEHFVRGSNALPGGGGLGLPLARAIAEAHGADIHHESEEGRGTRAIVTLPLAPGVRRVA